MEGPRGRQYDRWHGDVRRCTASARHIRAVAAHLRQLANLSDDPVWAFGVTVPAGLEAMFAEQSAYFAALAGPPDEAVIAAIGNRYGVRVVGPPVTSDA